VGILGLSGVTAYWGLLDIGIPKEGEAVVVSGAAGAVGLAVGQIAKIQGCKVIGIAGSEEKIQMLKEFGYDTGCNYKSADFEEQFKKSCPKGVDVYYDNVGGHVSDVVMKQVNVHARVVCCGTISQYNNESKEDIGLRPQWILVERSVKMQGFIVFRDYGDRWNEGVQQLLKLYKAGKIKWVEDVEEGIENAPKAFIKVMKGKNRGKQIVKVADIGKEAQ